MDFEIRNQKCNQKSGSQPTWPGFLDSQRFIGCNGIDDCCAAQATWRQDAFMMRHGRTRCVDAPSRELDGLMTDRERKELVQRAVALRRLVRVKVADCADIEQARESLKLIVEFLGGLQQAAAQEKRSLTSLLREL